MALCKSCSAPLESYSIKCDYCGVRNDVDLKGIHEYTLTKPETERVCPHCAKPMQTIDLNIEGTFYVERCVDCLGMFFDPGELAFMLDKTVKKVLMVDYQGLQALNKDIYRRESLVQYIKCPVCQDLMNRINFGARSGVIVDRCRTHGLWLDGGEFRRLMEWRKAGGQILKEKRTAEQREAEKKRKQRKASEHQQYVAKAHQQDGGMYFSSHRNDCDWLGLVADVVFNLFR